MSENGTPTVRLSRRQFLAAGGATATAAVAGCTEGAINWVAGHVLEEVNVFNATNSSVEGAISVVGPDDETHLDEEFDVAGDGGSGDEDDGRTYDDVWADAGSYEVSVDLESEVDGVSEATEAVSIEDPDDDMLMILLGSDDIEEAIAFSVGDSFTDAFPETEDE
jgi:hypothetical protein